MRYLVDIDSGERNPTRYPNPNQYAVHLNTPIYNVTDIRLVSARIPNCQPLLNDGNRQFDVNGASVVIEGGTYTNGTDLASNLQLQMAPPNTVIDTVTYNGISSKLTFSNTSPIGSETISLSGGPTGITSNIATFIGREGIYDTVTETIILSNHLQTYNFLNGESFADSLNNKLVGESNVASVSFNSGTGNLEFEDVSTSLITEVLYVTNGTQMASMLLSNIGLGSSEVTNTEYDSITFNATRNDFAFSNIDGAAITQTVPYVSGTVTASDLDNLLVSNTNITSVTFNGGASTLTFAPYFTSTFTNFAAEVAQSIQDNLTPDSGLTLSLYEDPVITFSNAALTTIPYTTDYDALALSVETLTIQSVIYDSPDLLVTNNFSMKFFTGSNGYATNTTVGPPAHVMGFNGTDTPLGNTITSSYVDLQGPTSIIVALSTGPDDVSKQLYINNGTFSFDSSTYDSPDMRQLGPRYIGKNTHRNVG